MTSTLRFDRWETSAGEGIVDGTVASLGRNLLYNGAMQVAQRGTSFSAAGYTLDRWAMYQSSSALTVTQDSEVPTGFTKSMKFTVSSAGTRNAADYYFFFQNLEGLDTGFLGFGAAGAQTITMSFWVRSSVTGLFSGALGSGDNNRHYGFTYTISSANTWEKKTVTIAGDTSGGATAYPLDNTAGLRVKFDLGSGSNYQTTADSWAANANRTGVSGTAGFAQTGSATFYVTGVQLEAGTVATTFEHKAYGVELAECQRYYVKLNAESLYAHFGSGVGATTTDGIIDIRHAPLRAGASAVEYSGVRLSDIVASSQTVSNITVQHKSDKVTTLQCATTGLSTYRYYALLAWNDLTAYVALSSEL